MHEQTAVIAGRLSGRATGGTRVEYHRGACLGPTAWVLDRGDSMSGFSAVDGSSDPASLARYLDTAALTLSGMKAYMAATHKPNRPDGPLLDLGCGAGQDLELLSGAGITGIGLDPSAALLGVARERVERPAPLVQGRGETLPFRDRSFAGVRVDRVLQHVFRPEAILVEAVRVLRPGGLLTAFEPDWSRLRCRTESGESEVSWLSGVANPGIGGQLWELAEQAGCVVLDRVEELSVWQSLAAVDRVLGTGALDRAVAGGRITAEGAKAWLAEQRQREAAGMAFGTLPKVLIVAQKPS